MPAPTLLVLAAGMGSRYGGLKQLDAFGPRGETLLDYSVQDAVRAGFQRIVFLIRRDIENEFRKKIGARYEGKLAVGYAFQELDDLPPGFAPPAGRTKPWGTAHAVWCARGAIETPFAAINADDFYGAATFRVIADFLRGAKAHADPAQFAMAAFRLDRTLSEHGTVARGVCEVGDGFLLGIEEMTDIARRDDGMIASAGRVLPAAAPVSMNFWGFTPEVFPLLEEVLCRFLAIDGTSEKTECYLPAAVAAMIAAGRARVRVLETASDWFGVTYRADREQVVRSIAALVARGEYAA